MRVLFTGGGTGGHIYPALTLAKGLQEEDDSISFLFVGTNRGLERDLVPRAGFTLRTITVSGLERRLSWRTILTFARLGKGLWQAYRILQDFRPHVVVGTGGYVSLPVVFVAARLGIPTLLHEQNVLPGLANRYLSRYATVVAASYGESKRYFPRARRFVVTGNPVREEIVNLSREEGRACLGIEEGKRLLLVFGGSRGARPVNDALLAALPELVSWPELITCFITGKENYDYVRQGLGSGIGAEKLGNIIIKPYLHDMPAGLAAADLVIARAGATTLAELTARGVPAILIPSPYVTGNHQEYNARLLEAKGAAVVIRERELDGSSLAKQVLELLQDPSRLQLMGKKSRGLGQRQAREDLVALIYELAARK
ncbi:MAG TPA: undecaprenyldiphospho-muramoylpentapeptide beta-N-acetylglucosaminyltransferase [Firmicutes bacterium]|nr:undecaprenyldiphospho-muramoylpentapeptide beta-N-acetylglucosaminyltransferase [Bacillota bacterium]